MESILPKVLLVAVLLLIIWVVKKVFSTAITILITVLAIIVAIAYFKGDVNVPKELPNVSQSVTSAISVS